MSSNDQDSKALSLQRRRLLQGAAALPLVQNRRQALASNAGPTSSARRDSQRVARLQPVNPNATAGSVQVPRYSHAWPPAAAPSDMPTYSADALIANSMLRRSGARPIKRFC